MILSATTGRITVNGIVTDGSPAAVLTAERSAMIVSRRQARIALGEAMCNALEQHPAASFYAAVARLTRAFAAVEAQGFDMLD